jgi:dynein heavy chain 1
MTLNAWFSDFVRRCEDVSKVFSIGKASATSARLGGQFFPEALITATRQLVAQRNGWSVEELDMEVKVIGDEAAAASAPDSFVLESGLTSFKALILVFMLTDNALSTELKLEGAIWRNGAVEPTPDIQTPLPRILLRWINRAKAPAAAANDFGSLPVYLNSDRSDLLFTARLPVKGMSQDDILQRGIAVVCL